MKDQWYFSRNGETFGPYTWEELHQFAQTGQINSKDKLWNQELNAWHMAEEIAGLFDPPVQENTYFSSNSDSTLNPSKNKLFIISIASIGLLILVAMSFLLWRNSTGSNYFIGNKSSAPSKKATTATDSALEWANLSALEKDIQGSDALEWKNYPDLKQEQSSINQTLQSFIQALKQGDIDASVHHIQENQRDGYRELFSSRPEAMESFAEMIRQAEMSFLSTHSPTEPFHRTAEYQLVLDDFTFYLVFMKIDDKWMLYDF